MTRAYMTTPSKSIHAMKTRAIFLLYLAAVLLITSCLTAGYTAFESARTLAPGTMEVQGTGTFDIGDLSEPGKTGWGTRSISYGLTAAYGLTREVSLRARIEQFALIDRAELLDKPLIDQDTRANFGEFQIKYGSGKTRRNALHAIALPVAFLSYPNGSQWKITPTTFSTYTINDRLDITMIGKIHFWINHEAPLPWFSMGLGCGIKNKSMKWTFRPEIYWDIYNFGMGLGAAYNFSPKKSEKKQAEPSPTF